MVWSISIADLVRSALDAGLFEHLARSSTLADGIHEGEDVMGRRPAGHFSDSGECSAGTKDTLIGELAIESLGRDYSARPAGASVDCGR